VPFPLPANKTWPSPNTISPGCRIPPKGPDVDHRGGSDHVGVGRQHDRSGEVFGKERFYPALQIVPKGKGVLMEIEGAHDDLPENMVQAVEEKNPSMAW